MNKVELSLVALMLFLATIMLILSERTDTRLDRIEQRIGIVTTTTVP